MNNSDHDLFIPHKLLKYPQQSMEEKKFIIHKRHFFVSTLAGKPIFSRYCNNHH